VGVNAGERAARERVEAVYAAVDRLTPEDLSWTSVPDRDLEERTVLLADLEHEVDRHGRGALLDEARTWLRDAIAQRVASRGWFPEVGVAGISRLGRADDIADVRLALEDAVSVAVAEDVIDPVTAAALADPGRRLLRMDPLPASSVEPVPAADPWEPSPADWAAAVDDGPAVVDGEQPMDGSRGMQAVFFAGVGAFGALTAIVLGLAGDQWLLGVLAAVAIGVLAWTFATYRPARRSRD
jgi:hypothetical protein